MGTEDVGCGPTMLQVRVFPSLEQGERKEQEEIALEYFGSTEDVFTQLKGKDSSTSVW